jgi:hypothetical protein
MHQATIDRSVELSGPVKVDFSAVSADAHRTPPESKQKIEKKKDGHGMFLLFIIF